MALKTNRRAGNAAARNPVVADGNPAGGKIDQFANLRQAPPRQSFDARSSMHIACLIADWNGHPIDLLEEIARRWPSLAFRDYVGAVILAEALKGNPEFKLNIFPQGSA